MEYSIINKKVLSSNNKTFLVGKVYLPKENIRGYFHIVHGKTEHIARYDSFMKIMAANGYITFAYDHIGHGYTATDDSELGHFADKGGDDILAHDVKMFADAVIKEYGNYPYYLMGHSMGSFVVRRTVQKYITPNKLIVMGTSGPMPISAFGVYLARFIRAIRGPKHYSSLMDTIAFGNYNAKYPKEEGPHAWLTNNAEIRDAYQNDKFCTFNFTVSAMHDLIYLLTLVNKDEWFKDVANKMPIFLVSGADDVVGEYGKGVLAVDKKLREYGADVTTKLYEGNRHEILNDLAREECIKDILEFIK